MEVATARVYNWEVMQKRKDKKDGADDEKEAAKDTEKDKSN